VATINIPQRESDNVKIQGKNALLFVNAGEGATVESPNWLLVGGQRNSALEMSADEIDVSDKGSGGWGDTLAGTKTWSISLESIMVIGDIGAQAIKQAFLNDQEIQIMRWRRSSEAGYLGEAETGWVTVTEFSDDAPHDDAMTLTGTLNGRGAPTFLSDVPYPGGIKNLTATPGVESVTLTWTSPTGATSIKAQYSTNNITWTDVAIALNATSVVIENLLSETLYYFRLLVTGGDEAGFSNVVSATPTAE
jgi:TP901-1 family phage major tail protein